MIPLTIELTNFMSYRGEGEGRGLDLNGIHVACLTGANGAGKSTLLDAITWVLWGKARARTNADLIAHGETEMSVSMAFLAQDQHYFVSRTYTNKGAGHTRLELQIIDPLTTNRTPITEPTVPAMQRRITNLVQMSYETFINSAFILQGQADSFTVKSATERKQILADILGLGYYDTLVDRAKEKRDEAKLTHRDLNTRITTLKQRVDLRPQIERQRDEAQVLQRELEAQIIAAETRYRELDRQVAQIKRTRDDIANAQSRIDGHRREKEQAQTSAKLAESNLAQAEMILRQRTEIEEGYGALMTARADDDRMNDIGHKHSELVETLRAVETAIGEQETKINHELAKVRGQIATYQKDADNAPSLTKYLAELRSALARLGDPDSERTDLTARLGELNSAIGGLDSTIKRLDTDKKRVKEKAEKLPASGTPCPLCGTEMSAEAYETTKESFRDEWRVFDMQQKEATRNRVELNAERESITAALDKVATRANERTKLLPQETRTETQLTTAKEAAIKIEKVTQQVVELERRLATHDYAHNEHADAVTLREDIATLNYDKNAHQQIRKRKQELAAYQERKKDLDLAQQKAESASERLKEKRDVIAARNADIVALEADVARLQAQIAGSAAIETQATDAQRTWNIKKAELRDIDKLIGSLDSDVEACDRAAQELPKVNADFQKAAEQISVYEELVTAFGKSGIQALVIEQVVPQLEDQANELLGRMSDGRMTVRFKTQRSLKTRDKVIEALDIEIADGLGVRPYEMYSGGEAFRINFAIRIALSKVLAQRSGAQLRTLVIDEGFGSQDTAGRDHIVGAIRAIEKDFDRILVITHIEELKNAFPVRIDVEKTPSGSRIVSMVQV